tara:strand:+ start:2303 stop:3136 length:834 start_codon:yes stop_codon:yes gene_type:complete
MRSIPKIKTAATLLVALFSLAPVCVLSGGDSLTKSETLALANDSVVEVVGENAAVHIHGVETNTLELNVKMNNAEFVDFHTQILRGNPASHYLISATTSTGGMTTANSVIEIGLPRNTKLIIRTTNKPVVVDRSILSYANISTSNGEIEIANSSGDFNLNTTNSEITVRSVTGEINASTSNAHVWFEGIVDKGSNSISTTNGDVSIRLEEGSNVLVSGDTRNGDVTIDGDNSSIIKDGDTATFTYGTGNETATLVITNGPGAIHINPTYISVFDGDK